MYNPKISIIIPVYNGADFMREAISSALSQTYKNIEIIVVNDGSKDGGKTEKTALEYGDKIRYIYKENGGSSSALNVGIKNMTGDYFSWLSHDDFYDKSRTEEMVKRIDVSKKDSQVIVCNIKLVDKDSKQIPYPKKQLYGEFSGEEMFSLFKADFNINGCSVLIPKELIEKTGFFDESLRFVNDTDYWFRLMMNDCIFTCFNKALVCSRIHKNQVTVTRSELFDKEIKILSEKVLSELIKDSAKNEASIRSFLIYSVKNGAVKAPLDAIGQLSSSKLKRFLLYGKVYFYFFYGRIVVFLKGIYKKIFFRR